MDAYVFHFSNHSCDYLILDSLEHVRRFIDWKVGS